MNIADFFHRNNWEIVNEVYLPEVKPKYYSSVDLDLASPATKILKNYPQGIFLHQYHAIKKFMEGKNVCITTATASGKSLVFYTVGADIIARKPQATILAVYPLKALTDEQESKWHKAMGQTGKGIGVGRIDGSVHPNKRINILKRSSVVIMTPDVIHAWLLSNLERSVQKFLSNLQLIVIDEAHTYSGVFGSNSAFLFRRITQISRMLGAEPQFVAASATINNPQEHLTQLTGEQFDIIDSEYDTSGRKASRLFMVNPPVEKDTMTTLVDLMNYIVVSSSHRFITFVDSRKQTEQLASVLRRTVDIDSEQDEPVNFDSLENLQVLPFRAGYEKADRKRIQERLQNGELRGVISTSALEMGIDIPWLTVGIIYGIPYSATSYYQRIGRVGRHSEGLIILVNNGTILSNRVFRNPNSLSSMPLAETALYLENKRIQYIHAMCLARPGGEYDQIRPDSEFVPLTDFPDGFVELCKLEQAGEVEQEFQSMKLEAGDDPNHVFPLRDVEVQFRVQLVGFQGLERGLGTLSFGQVMREAYPGAIYYYQTVPYRVVRVKRRQRLVEVRKAKKKYTTRPIALPALVFPNLTEGNIYKALRYDNLLLIESNLQIKESIVGFKERRGPNEFSQSYPLPTSLGYFFDSERFERNYFSSGVMLYHPQFEQQMLGRELLAEILFEAFLIQIPFERQDIRFATGKFRIDRGPIQKGQHFISIYDQTYGSLRLTSRLMEPNVLQLVLEKALDIALNNESFDVDDVVIEAIRNMLELSYTSPKIEIFEDESVVKPQNVVSVIMPGSIGLYSDYNNEEFEVENIVYTPQGLKYKGRRLEQKGERYENVNIYVPVERIVAIPGRSELGYYYLETGEIKKVEEVYSNTIEL